MTVTVYSTGPGCQKCRLTKRHLTGRGHEVIERPITDLNQFELEAAGFKSAPIVHAGDQSWDDYRPDRIDALVA